MTTTVVRAMISLVGAAVLAVAGVLVPSATAAPRPHLTEYRVTGKVILDLGPGIRGGVEAISPYKCINANGEFPFRTMGTAPEEHNLWIDVSESIIPACITVKSYQMFRVYTTDPYVGTYRINFAEDEDGRPARSAFTLKCSEPMPRHLACTQRDDLTVVITCKAEWNSPCPGRSTGPRPFPDFGS